LASWEEMVKVFDAKLELIAVVMRELLLELRQESH
jgi:hypothetical protein